MFKKFFKVVNEYEPDFDKGYAYLALCCYDLGKQEEFLITLHRAVEKNPQEARMVLGFLFPEGMDPSDYIKWANQNIRIEEKN
jgi:hypothetical protein